MQAAGVSLEVNNRTAVLVTARSGLEMRAKRSLHRLAEALEVLDSERDVTPSAPALAYESRPNNLQILLGGKCAGFIDTSGGNINVGFGRALEGMYTQEQLNQAKAFALSR